MTARIFKSALFLFFVTFASANLTLAQEEERTKNLHHEFTPNADSRLVIENKYGDVDIKNWDKQQIVIDVRITVQTSDQSRSEELLSFIQVNFMEDGNDLKAITDIDEEFSKTRRWVNFDSYKEFSIDYTVNLPKDIKLYVLNRYGNVFINEHTGHVDIAVKYGTLRANKLLHGDNKPYSTITLAYTSKIATIEETDWLKVNIKYSNLEIEKAQALLIMSKYSDLHVDQANSIVSESKYDDYRIGDVTNFVTSSGYSDFRINEVKKTLEVDLKYADLRVNYMPANFKSIEIDSKYGGIRVGIDPEASYKLKGEAEYCKIYVPNAERLNRITDNNEMSLSGVVGSDQTNSTVKVYTKYGNVRLYD